MRPWVWISIAIAVTTLVWQHVGRVQGWESGTPAWGLHKLAEASRTLWGYLGRGFGHIYNFVAEIAAFGWRHLRQFLGDFYETLADLVGGAAELLVSPAEAVREFWRTFDWQYYSKQYPVSTLLACVVIAAVSAFVLYKLYNSEFVTQKLASVIHEEEEEEEEVLQVAEEAAKEEEEAPPASIPRRGRSQHKNN